MDNWLPWFVLAVSVLLIAAAIAFSGCTTDDASGQAQENPGSSPGSPDGGGLGPTDFPPEDGPLDGGPWGPPPG